MYRGKQVAIVVPAYNEANLIGEVLRTLPDSADRAYVIDDGSTDGTWREIQRLLAERRIDEQTGAHSGPELVPIQHETNRGVGAAIKTGYRRAESDGVDVAVVMNGDGQMDPEICDRLLEPVVTGQAAYAKGNRLLAREHCAEMSRFRLVGNVALTYLTKAASGYWQLMDPQNGYTAISVAAIEQLSLDRLCDRYGFCNDLLIALNAHELTVADVSMEAVYGEEESSIQYSHFVPRVSGLLLSGLCWRLKSRYLHWEFHPLVWLYAVGIAGTLASVVGAVLVLGGTPSITGLLATVILFVLSTAVVALGVTFDLEQNVDLQLRIRAHTTGSQTDRQQHGTATSADQQSAPVESMSAPTDTEQRPAGRSERS